jgi:hypothetical protein
MQYYNSQAATFEPIEMFEELNDAAMRAVWAGTGCTVTRNTANKFEGNSCMQVIVDATGNRTLTGQIARDYNLSTFVRIYARSATAGATFRMRVKDYDGNIWTCPLTFTITAANTWQMYLIDVGTMGEDSDSSGATVLELFGLNASTTYQFDSYQQYGDFIMAIAASMNIELVAAD